MKKLHVFSIGQIRIYIHSSLLLYILYAVWTRHVKYILISLLSILIHEAAHAVVAALLGNKPSSIELSPLGAVMYLDEEKKQSGWKRAATILAGPITTIAICGISIHLTKACGDADGIVYLFFMANVSILAVNLLPVLPLDGGRLFALILEKLFTPRYVTRILRVAGTVTGLFLILLNIVCSYRYGGWNLSLALAGCCIWYCAYTSTTTQALREMRFFLDRKIMLEKKACLPVCEVCALSSTPIRHLLHQLPTHRYALYLCVEAGTLRTMSRITEAELIHYYFIRPDATLGRCSAALSGYKTDK